MAYAVDRLFVLIELGAELRRERVTRKLGAFDRMSEATPHICMNGSSSCDSEAIQGRMP
jgi:hypothetical protein